MEREVFFIVKQVEKTMKYYDMLHGCSRIIVALSGGADSVCLLSIVRHICKKCSIAVEAAHLNHNLRGEASQADEAFVRELCQKWEIPLFVKNVDVKEVSQKRKIAVEEAGRNARYAFFDELAGGNPAVRIATAHNRNDNAETMMMHFLRGAGVDGMAGIPYKRGAVIRPILDLTREQVERYNRLMNLEFVTDQTNLENIVTRNRIRNTLLPHLEAEYNPNLIQTLARSSEFIRADQDYLEKACNEIWKQAIVQKTDRTIVFKRKKVLDAGLSICMRMIKRTAEEWGIVFFPDIEWFRSVWAAIREGAAKQICYHNTISVQVEEGYIYLRADQLESRIQSFCCRLKLGNRVWSEQLQKHIYLELTTERIPPSEGAFCFDADQVLGDVVVRSRKKGDFFYPLGMGGRKKVKDYLIDKKIPQAERDYVPIISCEAGIMQVGSRIDSRFCITADTKNTLLIKF